MGKTGIFLPYQSKWVADDADVKVWEKSRRIGASWCEAADAVLSAAQKNGTPAFYIGYNHEMARGFIEDGAFWAKHYNFAAGEMEEFVYTDEDKDILSFRIKLASGFGITALSSKPRNLRNKKGTIIIDEAAFHDDLEGMIQAAMATLMWGGKVRIISTDFGDNNPFNDLLKDIKAKKKPYSFHRTTLDDAIEDGLYKQICKTRKLDWSQEIEKSWRENLIKSYGDGADEELFCIPSQGTGAYFTRATVEKNMESDRPLLRFACKNEFASLPDEERTKVADDWCEENLEPLLSTLDKNRRHYFGEDFGRSGDLTVIHPIEETQTLNYKTPFIVELRNVPFKEQEYILFFIVDRLPRFSGGALDARGNGQYLAEVAMQKYGGSHIHEVMLTQKWYGENFPPYKAALEDATFSLPKHSDILNDHRFVKLVNGIPAVPQSARGKGSDGGQRHADSVIAAVLANFAAKNGISFDVTEARTTGQKRETAGVDKF